MMLFSANNISKTYSDTLLFENISFGMEEGDRVGVIGKNGVGKTTFMRIIAGKEESDSGIVAFNSAARFEYLDQAPIFAPGGTAVEAVMSGRIELYRNISRHRELCDIVKLSPDQEKELHDLAEAIDIARGWSLESEAQSLLSKLGLEQFSADPAALSGGQKKRVALARALLSDPDLLMLDEPTNHLDAMSVQWLQEYLQQSGKGILLITHDRYFLDAVSDKIIEIDRSALYSFPGNYEKYLERKEAMIDAEEAAAAHLRNKLRTELAWLQRGAKARRTKQQSRIDWIEKMQAEPPPPEERSIKIEIGNQFLGGRIIDAYNISKTIGSTPLFLNFSYTAAPGDRIGIIGANGSGKSTLLRVLSGKVPPDTGSVKIGETVKIGFFTQENTEFDPTKTVISTLRDIAEFIDVGVGRERYISAKELLDKFLFTGSKQYSRIDNLSGGELRRLALLCVLMNNPNVLFLDEPTNDFDLATLSALEEYLQYFKGVLVVVSHDRSFLDKTVDFIYAFENKGDIKQYPGNYSEYLTKREEFNSEIPKQKKQISEKNTTENISVSQKKTLSFKEQKELKELEKNIAELEEQRKKIELIFSCGEESDYKVLSQLSEELSAANETIDEKMMRWLELSEKAT